jgi:hypothetical protein
METPFVQQYGPPLFIFLMICIAGLILWRTIAGSDMATVQRASLTMGTYEQVTQLVPLGCPTGDDTRLCDYYIASSSYSVFPSSSVYDYISDGILPLVIKAGARLVELDIYSDADGKPVVGLKNETMGYDYAKNSVSFESCCVSIANTAFNKVETKTASDPFVLSLMFHTQKTNTMEACAEIMLTLMTMAVRIKSKVSMWPVRNIFDISECPEGRVEVKDLGPVAIYAIPAIPMCAFNV